MHIMVLIVSELMGPLECECGYCVAQVQIPAAGGS